MSTSLREPKAQKIVLIAILGGAVLYAYFLTDLVPFTYKAGAAELDELTTEYTKLSSDLTKARQAVNSLPYLEKEFELLHEKWSRAQRLLPDEQETASLLRAVTLLGDQSGVDFLLFRPMVPTPAQYYTEHPVEVKVEGGYHEVATFLSELANMERILTVRGLTVAVPKGNESEEPTVASFTATTFTLGGHGMATEGEQDAKQTVRSARGGIAKQANRAKQTAERKVAEITNRGGTGDE
ncbi:MAG: type 4a pilus biogenesis protein PilO [Candidatus Eisenbacteria bacterium]|nr:type 4a pilus biogenesis protein PilO [Candidatus Latescibacterota bacterium]MBD3302305.1 type 4a pilus biogenesis protein PilO [Candidatus Eisenbacteria bacterium]